MRFRIGVHLGDVIEKADGTVYGDGVNIAARLEGMAEPGGIAVSEAVYGSLRGKVSANFEDQGERRLKNIPEPVRLYHMRVSGAGMESADQRGGAGDSTHVSVSMSRQTFHRRAATDKHERLIRSRKYLSRRYLGGSDDGSVPLRLVVCDRPELRVHPTKVKRWT